MSNRGSLVDQSLTRNPSWILHAASTSCSIFCFCNRAWWLCAFCSASPALLPAAAASSTGSPKQRASARRYAVAHHRARAPGRLLNTGTEEINRHSALACTLLPAGRNIAASASEHNIMPRQRRAVKAPWPESQGNRI